MVSALYIKYKYSIPDNVLRKRKIQLHFNKWTEKNQNH